MFPQKVMTPSPTISRSPSKGRDSEFSKSIESIEEIDNNNNNENDDGALL